jgi:hypothetical protein
MDRMKALTWLDMLDVAHRTMSALATACRKSKTCHGCHGACHQATDARKQQTLTAQEGTPRSLHPSIPQTAPQLRRETGVTGEARKPGRGSGPA